MVSAYKAVSAGNWEQVTKLVHVITKFRLVYHRLGKMLVYIPRIGISNVSYRYSYYYRNESELFIHVFHYNNMLDVKFIVTKLFYFIRRKEIS